MDEKEVREWNERARPFHKKIVDTRLNTLKILFLIIIIILLIGFLILYGIRTYYYDFYRDTVDVSPICDPSYNLTTGSTECNVDCECMNSSELKDILKNVCPNTITINLNSS